MRIYFKQMKRNYVTRIMQCTMLAINAGEYILNAKVKRSIITVVFFFSVKTLCINEIAAIVFKL